MNTQEQELQEKATEVEMMLDDKQIEFWLNGQKLTTLCIVHCRKKLMVELVTEKTKKELLQATAALEKAERTLDRLNNAHKPMPV